MVSDQKREKFINALKKLGDSAGNRILRSELNWSEVTYDKVKADLLESNTIKKARGGGGKVILSKPTLRKTTEVIPKKHLKIKTTDLLDSESIDLIKKPNPELNNHLIFTVNDQSEIFKPGYNDNLLKDERKKNETMREALIVSENKIVELNEKIRRLEVQLRGANERLSNKDANDRIIARLQSALTTAQKKIRELEAPSLAVDRNREIENEDQKQKLMEAVIRYKSENESLKKHASQLAAENEILKAEVGRISTQI